jgi:hypothetical protein
VFITENFELYGQHHARFVDQVEDYTILLVFNNASNDYHEVRKVSEALILRLDLESMVAKVVKRYERPDGGLTRKRGGMQLLPNGNVFVSWSEYRYQSEFTKASWSWKHVSVLPSSRPTRPTNMSLLSYLTLRQICMRSPAPSERLGMSTVFYVS